MSIILITHDLGVVAQTADRVAVMYAGKIAEIGTRHDIFTVRLIRTQRGRFVQCRGWIWRIVSCRRLTGRRLIYSIRRRSPAFAARRPDRMIVCEKVYPATTVKSKSHIVNCWLQDHRAER